MNVLTDFKIIQRNNDGFAKVTFAKDTDTEPDHNVVVRVIREDDNSVIVPWTLAERTDKGFKAELTVPAGGLYRAEAKDIAEEYNPKYNFYEWAPLVAEVNHFGVGDVFIVAGQSNMSAYGRDSAYDPPELGVHTFNNRGEWCIATHPLNCCVAPIFCNNDSCSGTSPALSFGRMMHRRLNVPIGLVCAAQGGAPLRHFYPEMKDGGILFEALMKKLEDVGSVKGVIWYQGCAEGSSMEEALQYLENFAGMVAYWRERLGDIPFVTVQINRHTESGPLKALRPWGIVREAQRQAALVIKDVYTVPAIDLYTTDGIHNSSGCNVIIGERMAKAMLKGVYGLDGVFAPTIVKVTKKDAKHILLWLENGDMVHPMDNCADGLNIEDENGIMDCVFVEGNPDGSLTVEGEREIVGNAVFHAYWKRKQPAFFIRDIYGGMPMLACYGVKIED